MMLDELPWPYLPILGRLALAVAIGLFVGIERERRRKEAGLRTFAFTSLLGAVGGLLGEPFSLLALALVGVLVVFLNVETIRTEEGAEITTSAALLVTAFAGVLAGQGHTFTPTALGIVTAALLAWKEPLVGFSRALTESELRSAILLAILAFVAYPVVPAGSIDRWGLVEPRPFCATVLLIAGLGFTNYVLLKLYGERGVQLTGFLGGLVNSTVTVTELMHRAGAIGGRLSELTYRSVLLATAAMLIRNAVILGLLAPAALVDSAFPFALMIGGASVAAVVRRKQKKLGTTEAAAVRPDPARREPPLLALESPFSLSAVLKFGMIFLALQIAGALAQRTAGQIGFYAVSLAGGFVSSASAVASGANLAAAGMLSPQVAAIGAILASATSAIVNLPVVARLGKDRVVTWRLARVLGTIILLGAAGVLIQAFLLAKRSA